MHKRRVEKSGNPHKCSNYSSSNAPVMNIPISFNAGLLSQLTSPALFLIFEPNLNRATYNSLRLTRRSRVVTGRVGRIVLMNLHTQIVIIPFKKKNATTIGWGKKASTKLFRNMFLCLAQRQRAASTNGFCSCFFFFFFFFLFRCSEFMKCTSRETETAVWLSPLLSS